MYRSRILYKRSMTDESSIFDKQNNFIKYEDIQKK